MQRLLITWLLFSRSWLECGISKYAEFFLSGFEPSFNVPHVSTPKEVWVRIYWIHSHIQRRRVASALGKEVGLQTFTARKVDVGELLRIGDNCVRNFGETPLEKFLGRQARPGKNDIGRIPNGWLCYYCMLWSDKPHNVLYVPPGLTSKIPTLCSQCVLCFVRISEQTATFASYSINRLVVYNRGGQCLLCDVHWVPICNVTVRLQMDLCVCHHGVCQKEIGRCWGLWNSKTDLWIFLNCLSYVSPVKW
jgi:hypothetical protein